VVELQPALHLGDDRVGVRIPGGDHLPGLHRIFVADRDHRAVRDLVALPLAAELVDHGDLAGTGNGNQVAALVADRLDVEQPDRALGLDLHVVDRRRSRRRTTDMEGAHGQLRAGLADRLRGNDANRLADVDQMAAGQVTAVALGADAVPGLAGDRRADPDLVDAQLL